MYGRLIGRLGTMSPQDVVIAAAFAFILGWLATETNVTHHSASGETRTEFWIGYGERDGWHSLCRELVRRPNADKELLEICSDRGSAMNIVRVLGAVDIAFC